MAPLNGISEMDERPALTARQQEIVDFISERIASCGYPPTIREIGAHLGIRSTNGVADHLKALKRKGYLRQTAAKSRTWQVLTDKRAVRPARIGARTGQVAVPLLGRVAAGEPILAVEQAEEVLQVDAQLLPPRQAVFALKVVGNSMIEAGILPDDIIFVTPRSQADSGSIVVALIDDAATVKRYLPGLNSITFAPANASMKPLVLRPEQAQAVRIIGVVVGVFRRL